MSGKTTLERAFEIARSGLVSTVVELRMTLGAEGFVVSQIDGPALGRKLRCRIEQSVREAALAGTSDLSEPTAA